MDAKPQRPLRALRIRDENVPLASQLLPAKSIHQRNKSSPALSTFAHIAAAKPTVKRAAFADVSNTANNVHSIRDDSVISFKSTRDIAAAAAISAYRPTGDQENNKPGELSRPAQRPLSVAGIKGFLHTFASNNNSAPKPKTVDVIPDPPAVSTTTTTHWRPVSKKSTAVFKEVETAAPQLSLPLASIDPALGISLDLVTKPLLPESQLNLPPLPLEQPSRQFTGVSVPEIYPQTWQTLSSSQPAEDKQTTSDPLAIANHLNARRELPPLPVSDALSATSTHALQSKEVLQIAEKVPLPPIVEREDEPSAIPLPGSEITEYWDYGLDEADYDEEGYTTARSLKSRGDYTGGATTVIMAPKVTVKVERELAVARQIVEESRTAESIEEDESWDTSMVAEYGDEIFDYMRTLEEKMRPNPHYMDNQTEVQWSMRSVLMEWLVQVHHRFALLPETLFLCVNYIDRFLSCKVVSLGKLQLVGATAIFVAAKYEEINCPSVQEIVYMVDGGYTVDEILKAERFMLSMLQFELGWPGPMSFLRRISKADDYDLETRTLAKYFLELTIMDERFVASIPSFTAAGAHCLARLMLKKGSWTPAHVYYSNYTYSQLRQLMLAMLTCCEDPHKHHSAIFDKYGDKRFKRASFFVQAEMERGFVLPPAPKEPFASHHREFSHGSLLR